MAKPRLDNHLLLASGGHALAPSCYATLGYGASECAPVRWDSKSKRLAYCGIIHNYVSIHCGAHPHFVVIKPGRCPRGPGAPCLHVESQLPVLYRDQKAVQEAE